MYKATLQCDLTKHIQSKHKGKKYQCSSCDKEYKDASGLRKHTKSVHEGVTYNCNICDYKGTQKYDLKAHVKSLHLQEEKFFCKLCDFQTTWNRSLVTHNRNVHQKCENIICSECNKTIQKRSLTQHMKLSHSGEEPQYKCKVCTFQTKYQSGLKRHVKNIHEKH